jgi:hypothetical protein
MLYGVHCSVHKAENVKFQSFPGRFGCTAVQDLRYGHSLSSLIVINMKGCILGLALPTLRLEVKSGLLASSADKSVVLHVDSPINESDMPVSFSRLL